MGAHFGEDALASWGPAACIVHTGQLKLTASQKELCTLRAGDAIGVEKLLRGDALFTFDRSEVCTARLEAWVLPQERFGLADDAGLVAHITETWDAVQNHLL